ncbi:MAG: methionyl-tRNA formyltransferase [Thermoleophilaceae bacterium]|nr:methionyl-tRNA formyltransferase [Thermoleophilaceae bacterium]
MRTVYLGTSEFAGTVLERLAASAHCPQLVISRPDRGRGRGRKLTSPPVATLARELGIALVQPADVNTEESRAVIAAAEPEALVVCAFGALIREPLLSDQLIYNVHPSLLPRWRGAAPIERAIEAGDQRTGVCIMRLVAELDAGPISSRVEEPIRADDDFGSLSRRLAELGGEMLCEAIGSGAGFVEQGEQGLTYAEKIEPEDRRLDGTRPAVDLERRVRALHPHIGAQLLLEGGEPLGVEQVSALEATDLEPGRLVGREGRMLLGCAPGALELQRIKPSGGRSMAAADYLHGAGRGLVT